MKRELTIDSVWLTVMAIIFTIIFGLIFNFNDFLKGSVEIQMHDTYLVANPFLIISSGFLPVIYVVFGLRMTILKFERISTNVLFLIVTSFLIVLITLVIKQISKLAILNGGWEIYPPLSAIPPDETIQENTMLFTINNILSIIQLILIITLVITSIVTGKKIKHNAQHHV